jgi:hypothetical protein
MKHQNIPIKTTDLHVRCEGCPAQYWVLRLLIDGKLVGVHTSKTYSYLLEIQRGFLQMGNFMNVGA